MAKKKQNKLRTQFRKKHDTRSRQRDFTKNFREDPFATDDPAHVEQVSGKGDLTRHRTIVGDVTDDESGLSVRLSVDESQGVRGRVLAVHGLSSHIHGDDGNEYQCSTRGLLKNLNTDQRHVVSAGDRVFVRIASAGEGVIESVEPRTSVLSRSSKGRRHVIVTNVDKLVIVASAAEPSIKPNLIDRFLIAAEHAEIQPIICINKIDLIDPADLQPLVGVYGRMGYEIYMLSAATGFGVENLKRLTAGSQTVVAGQSGVGKSSLLNAIEPGLDLKVTAVSTENQKGKHTTTTAKLIPIAAGGYIVDTPGIRQFQLWDVIAEEIAGYYRDIRPYVSLCRFPDCTHIHESNCAVKNAVGDGALDLRRYESYCRLFEGDEV